MMIHSIRIDFYPFFLFFKFTWVEIKDDFNFGRHVFWQFNMGSYKQKFFIGIMALGEIREGLNVIWWVNVLERFLLCFFVLWRSCYLGKFKLKKPFLGILNGFLNYFLFEIEFSLNFLQNWIIWAFEILILTIFCEKPLKVGAISTSL